MTIKYSSTLYGVGSFLPPSCPTMTSSTHYSQSFPSTMNTSTTNVCSSIVNTFTRDMLLSPHLARTEYNGLSSSRVVQSRARCRTPPAQPSVTCPGERGITTAAAMAAEAVGDLQHLHAQQTQSSRMELNHPIMIQKMDTWPESFQDLRSWCHADRDELNTPHITMQDEFSFSQDGPMNNWDIIIPSPVDINDHLLNHDLLTSPNIHIVDEENNNYTVIQGNFSSFIEPDNMNKSSLGKVIDFNSPPTVMMPGSSALKMKGSDVLWSQAVRLEDSSPDVTMGGGSFDIKLNSSSSTAAKLGSGGKLVVKVEDPEEFRVPVSAEALAVPVIQQQHQQQPSFHTMKAPLRDKKAIEEFHAPVKENVEPVSVVIQQQQQPEVQPQRHRGKPKPKLKVSLPQSSNSSSLDTPDVLKPLTDISTNGFNLLQYVCGGGDNSRTQTTVPSKESTITLQDHNYTESTVDEGVFIKSEPLSPVSYTALPNSSRKRRRPSSPFSDEDDGDSDSGSEWVPDFEDGRRQSSTTSTTSSGAPRAGRRGRFPSSGAESFEGTDRYRALRDRNNEASRRSRQNRKQRDMEIKKHKSELEKKNAVLRVKAGRMEALVKEMRATLLQSIKNSRNNTQNM